MSTWNELGVHVGVALGVPVAVAVGVAEGITVGVGVDDGEAVGVAVGVDVAVAVAVAVGVGVGVPQSRQRSPSKPSAWWERIRLPARRDRCRWCRSGNCAAQSTNGAPIDQVPATGS